MADEVASSASSSITAVYHRSIEEIEKMETLDETTTVCPVCKLIIKGTIYRDGDNVMIRKHCPEHGWFIEKYWEDYDMYMKMRKYNYNGRGVANPNVISPTKGANCPFDCGLCEAHKSHTALANVVVTNRCHLSCWYCFFFAKEGEPIYEPNVSDFDKLFKDLRNQKPIPPNAVQLTGGEPTLHPDIIEIVKKAKEAGFDQVQLNTTGITLGQKPEFAVKLRHAGVSTLYMSFDGVSARANPKNHWEIPATLEAAKKAGIGIVLVPTVIRGINENELGAMINFALNNMDIVRAVNFQPVSLVGRMPTAQRESQRITIPGAIKLIEEQTNGTIAKEDWASVPYTGGISKFIEALTGEYKYDLSIHFACGAGTYVYLDRKTSRLVPITRFVDVNGLVEYLDEVSDEINSGSNKYLQLARVALKIRSFVDKTKEPDGLDLGKLLFDVLFKHDYSSMGKLQMNSLFLGMMHFQDKYNHDEERLQRCDIHYLTPDMRIIPFCSFNVIPEWYRDRIQKKYGMPVEEWERIHNEKLEDRLYRGQLRKQAIKEGVGQTCLVNEMLSGVTG